MRNCIVIYIKAHDAQRIAHRQSELHRRKKTFENATFAISLKHSFVYLELSILSPAQQTDDILYIDLYSSASFRSLPHLQCRRASLTHILLI